MMKHKLSLSLLIAVAILLLSGCSMSNAGTIKGILVDGTSGEPVSTSLELWRVEIGEDGQTVEILPEVERVTIESDESGAFKFKDVEPGHYMIFTKVGFSLMPLEYEHKGTAAIVVEAGQVVDLGEISMSKEK